MIDYHINRCKNNSDNIIRLSKSIVWSIDNNPNNNEYLTQDKYLNKKAIIKNEDKKVVRYLVVPLHRFSLNYYTILLDNKEYSIGDILTIIYEFYNKKELSYTELKSLNSCDVYDYINEQCLELKSDPCKKVYPINIMGDLIKFHKIYIDYDKCGDIQYMLHLDT